MLGVEIFSEFKRKLPMAIQNSSKNHQKKVIIKIYNPNIRTPTIICLHIYEIPNKNINFITFYEDTVSFSD